MQASEEKTMNESGEPKFELFSREWVNYARQHLERRAAEAATSLEGVEFRICEVLTDPPPHLALPGTNRVSWHIDFDGPKVTVTMGEIDCPFKVVGDYRSILPAARKIYGDTPEAVSANRERLNRLGIPPLPPPLRPVLLDLHDVMARRTA